MKKGEFYLKKLIAGKGCYVHIILEAEVVTSNDMMNIQYANKELEQWKSILDFGMIYFQEHFRKKNIHNSLSVKVIEVNYQIIDTTSILVLYAFLKAVSQAINFNIDINIDESECKFCFSK